ncbi:ABC-2 family transporter protein [Micromonospora coriariae]|uniref:ABC-2 family transporter protein n=1 Tax=Micromonospora coriariae TaxID=285665 RepID=A0A1C4X8J6_9ACTN|nr:ABC transporter permease subunit [Micromonospora coriariae]SCF04521.1 ABC-2 family transporter protein [Micromonospora coriariae]
MTTVHRRADPLPDSGRPGFGRLLLSEWAKLRSVRRWTLALLAAPVLTVLVSLLAAASSGPGNPDSIVEGPDGTWVQDRFHFVHRPLTGDGSVTTRVSETSLDFPAAQDDAQAKQIQPPTWTKAGLMIKDGVRPGARYAAVMVTAGHGVRLQSNFTTDIAGPAVGAPTWLRLTRVGATISAFQSADGVSWTPVGTVTVAGLPQTVEVGPFVTSPPAFRVQRQFGSGTVAQLPTSTRATFERPTLEPAGAPAAEPGESGRGWQDDEINDAPVPEIKERTATKPGAAWAGDRLTLTGTGDVAPRTTSEDTVAQGLTGIPVGLVATVAVAVLFVTAEHRHGMLRTTFMATPGRRRVLAAKALVVGAVAFILGLVAAVTALLVVGPIQRQNGYLPPRYPDWSLTDAAVLRAVIGTAVVLTAIAVFGMALGSVLRRAAGAVAIVIVLLFLPQLLATGLPGAVGTWLMRLTPAAGFTIQQTTPHYDHVSSICLPQDGCAYDQSWAGLAVCCAYAVAMLVVALWLVRRRDA